MSDDLARLDKLDIDLRQESDEFLAASGLGQIISEAGFTPVGSYTMRTMAWRDLDFERTVQEPTWHDCVMIGQKISELECVWRLSCIDAYRDEQFPHEAGIYLGIRAGLPNGPAWKFDLWTARAAEFAYGQERRATWASLMTDEARLIILAIKEVVCSRPEYGKTMLSVHIYEAVLENQIRGIDEFLSWWKNNYAY